MGVIKLNGKEYGKGGGGGNANIVELTQAEYDTLPESKLTDGILYCITDGDGDVINFVNGVYVNPDNLIVSNTAFRSSLSYTATQDCIVCMYLVCLNNSSTFIKIDNKVVQNYWQSTLVTTASAPIYVKKGQTLTVSGVHGSYDSAYWVYGVQTGSVSNAQHNYSTSEQVIGTWIDGKPLYQKTIDQTIGSDADYTVFANGIDHAHLVNSCFEYSSGRWMSFDYISLGATSNSRTCYVDVQNGALNLHNQSNSSIHWVATIQYTKTTD